MACPVPVFRYLNFDKLDEYVAASEKVELSEEYYPTLQKELERLQATKN